MYFWFLCSFSAPPIFWFLVFIHVCWSLMCLTVLVIEQLMKSSLWKVMCNSVFACSACSFAPWFTNQERLKSIMGTRLGSDVSMFHRKGEDYEKWRKKENVVSEEEKRLEIKVGLGVVPMSGRGGNIMIEKWFQPLLPVGGVHANTLCFNEWIFWCIYLLINGTIIFCLPLGLSQRDEYAVCPQSLLCSVKRRSQKHDWNCYFLDAASSTFRLFSLVCIVSFLTSPCLPIYFLFLPPSSSLLLFCCLWTSNPGSCVNAFSIPTLFIVPSSKTLPVFLPFNTLWLSAHFLCTCFWFGGKYYHSFQFFL